MADAYSEQDSDVWISKHQLEHKERKTTEMGCKQKEKSSLLLRISLDTATALTAALAVSPAMTIIDK